MSISNRGRNGIAYNRTPKTDFQRSISQSTECFLENDSEFFLFSQFSFQHFSGNAPFTRKLEPNNHQPRETQFTA